jgi:hypothetical protein
MVNSPHYCISYNRNKGAAMYQAQAIVEGTATLKKFTLLNDYCSSHEEIIFVCTLQKVEMRCNEFRKFT